MYWIIGEVNNFTNFNLIKNKLCDLIIKNLIKYGTKEQ